jgi:hypothetical protein
MSEAISKEKQAQLLLQPGYALQIARAARIKNIYEVSEFKSVDLVKLVANSMLAIEHEKPAVAERYLTELLAVLISRQVNLSEEIGFELTVRDDLRKVKQMANRLCRDAAEQGALDKAPTSTQIHRDPDDHSKNTSAEKEL